MSKRAVICHYHIFKNSGTSFERVLDDNYGDQHITFDGPFFYFQINQSQLADIIEQTPKALACSSHHIHLPAPTTTTFTAVPVLFVRHPLLRIRSMYLFSNKRPNDADRPETSDDVMDEFEPWLEQAFADKDRRALISNAQTNMLSHAYNQAPRVESRGGRLIYDIAQAARNLNNVPCLGRTEHFDADVASFEPILEQYGLSFEYTPRLPENVSSTDYHLPTEQRLASLRSRVSEATWQKLEYLNNQDLELWDLSHRIVERNARGEGLFLPKER